MRGREYLFIPRKGQITISFLLIFFILFSIFAVSLFGSREMWASAKFKAAVDSAALSAGADMAKGADLFITLTSVRLALFDISMILYIVSIPFPMLFSTANSINSIAKEVSKALFEFSKYIPAAYFIKSEVDAYKEFTKNFGLDDQNISSWSINDYGIVVIPNYSLENIKEGSLELLPMGSDSLNDSLQLLREGVSVFGYRKMSYLEQIRNNLGVGENTTEISGVKKVKSWIDTHDIIMSSCSVNKLFDSGVDISDALKISNFLNIWESGKLDPKEDKDKSINKIYEEILTEANELVKKVKETQDKICFSGNKNYNNKDCLNKKAVDAASKISCDGCENCEEIKNRLNQWIEFCEGGGEWKDSFQGNINLMKNRAYGGTFDLNSLIILYEDALKDPSKSEKLKELGTEGNLWETINDIFKYANSANTVLQSEIDKLNSLKCKKTYTDENGASHVYYSELDLSSTIGPMSEASSLLNTIADGCKSVLYMIDNASSKVDEKLESGKEGIVEQISGFLGSLGDMAGAFQGFPGGSFLAYVAGKYSCTNECQYCDKPIIGDLACAIMDDISKLKNLLKKDEKFEFISYYTARLDKPSILSSTTQQLTEGLNVEKIADSILDGVQKSLEVETYQDFDAIDIAVSVGGTIISGLLTAGSSFVIGVILTTLTETVIKPLICETIKDLVIPKLRDQVGSWISSLKEDNGIGGKIIDSIDGALQTFCNYYNSFQNLKVRMIGESGDTDKLCLNFTYAINILGDRAAPEQKKELFLNEEIYIFE